MNKSLRDIYSSPRGLVLGCVLALQFCFAGNVLRAEEKRKKLSVQVESLKREKSTASLKPGDGTGKPRMSTSEIFAVEVERKLVRGINKTISYLNRTARSLPKKSATRLEMLSRVHNLHMEQAVYVASEEQRRYDDRWNAWERRGKKGREPKLGQSGSRKHWKKVSTTARNILREYPNSKGADNINFNQALSLSFLGQEKNAARAFTQLIQKYPNSPVSGDAYFSLGDYYFDRHDFRNAKNNFTSALKYRKSRRYGWALFKLGWCYYNLGQYRQALKFWKNTIGYSKRAGEKKGRRLKEEAMRDLVYAFSELKEVEAAISYFKANGGHKYIGQFLRLLADTYADQGRFKRSIKVWQRLQSILPNDPNAALAQFEIISLYFELNQLSTVWKELAKYHRVYGKSSRWARQNKRQLVLETRIKIEDAVMYYAKLVHKNAQKRTSKPLYAHSIKGYSLFLKLFPKAREAAEIKFNLADIKFYRKEYRKSGMLYLEIAMLGKKRAKIYNAKGKVTKDIHPLSAKYMLDSYNRDFEAELRQLIKRVPNFSKPARTLSLRSKNFIKACQNYSKWYPADKKTIRTCDTFITEIYYRNNDKKMALKYLWLLATKYAGTKAADEAVENLIPLYKSDKKGLLLAVNKLLAISAYKKGKIGKKLMALRRAAAIEAIAAEKNPFRRAKLYEDRARKNPRDKDAAKFWNNAAVDYLSSGSVLKSISAYATLVKVFPRSKLSQGARLQLSKLYDRRLDFPAAASNYLLFAKQFPKAKESSGAIQRACDLQIATSSSSAPRTCAMLLKSYPANAKAAFSKMIYNAWRQKKYSQMTNLINKSYFKMFRPSINEKIILNYKIYKAYNGRGAAAQTAGARIAGFLKSTGGVDGEALRYLGEIAFRKSDPVLFPYLKQTLRGGTVDNMLASINKKTAALNKVEKQYGAVLATKDSYWGVAAYHQIGAAYEQFSEMLKNPPAIKGAKIADVQKQLSVPASQARSKAMQYYKAGADISKKLSVYSEWPAKIKTAMARMNGKIVSFDDWVISPDFVGSEVSTEVAAAMR